MPRKPFTEQQKIAHRKQLIDRHRQAGDSDAQAYERFRQHMRDIARAKQSLEARKKQVETYKRRNGEDAYRINGSKGGRAKRKSGV